MTINGYVAAIDTMPPPAPTRRHGHDYACSQNLCFYLWTIPAMAWTIFSKLSCACTAAVTSCTVVGLVGGETLPSNAIVSFLDILKMRFFSRLRQWLTKCAVLAVAGDVLQCCGCRGT